jgi:predicted ribosomally synthesized peptide with SipW-like signal peptide
MDNTYETYEPRPHRRRRRGLFALLMAGAALISATGATMSLALFTSTVTANNNVFTTGTIVLGVVPSPIILSAAPMMPGDAVPAGVPGQVVTVSNTGTGLLWYAITGASTNTDTKALDTQLVITIKLPDTVGGNSCTLMTGASLFSGVVPVAPATNLVGNPVGVYSLALGDRLLGAGLNETLCFKASLPLLTGDTFQGATSTYTFTFIAAQKANN